MHKGRWIRTRHLDFICALLEKVESGEISRLIISMPPRHGKSMLITETFPSWFLGKNPEKRVIEVSYGADLARGFGEKNKRKIVEYGDELFGIKVNKFNRDKSDWGLQDHEGGMVSAGIGGALTGKGADLLLIDDPLKNRQEADSPTYRARLWGEWQSTLSTRLHPYARVVLAQTRWHQADLAGKLIEEEANQWVVVNLPAIAEDCSEDGKGIPDPLGRAPGEPLWPERFTLENLLAKKKTVGSRDWEALYQGRPSPQSGNMFNRSWWREYPHSPSEQIKSMDCVIFSWDCTFKDSVGTDYVVGQVWGKKNADFYIFDQVRGRMDFPATLYANRSLATKWPQATAKLVEDKANGSAVIATLRREISGMLPVEPCGGKIVRANAVSPFVEAGNVWLPSPKYAPWVHDFIEEAAAFPGGSYDDQVDAMTQALQYLGGGRSPIIISTFGGGSIQ